MDLKKIITAKNAGFRKKTVNVEEWGVSVTVREPLHVDFNRYITTVEDINNNKKLSEKDKDLQKIAAEAALFAAILVDEDGNLVFDGDISELVKSYGPLHTRLLNESISLIGFNNKPIEEAEKK